MKKMNREVDELIESCSVVLDNESESVKKLVNILKESMVKLRDELGSTRRLFENSLRDMSELNSRLRAENETLNKKYKTVLNEFCDILNLEGFTHADEANESMDKIIESIKLQITDKAKAESELIRNNMELTKVNRELDEFAYIVSHDLKAPLRAINSLSCWIEDDIKHLLANDSLKNFEILRGRVTRMEEFINAILTYTKTCNTKMPMSITDTGSLVQDIFETTYCPNTITLHKDTEFPTLITESVKLQQVLANLISNSIKYNNKESGWVKVGCIELEEFCQFYVEDNGPGIDEKFHQKIFKIFQTLDAKDEKESTGIGLSIVKRIIEDHQGKIWVESQEGAGCKFSFLWPKINELTYKTA